MVFCFLEFDICPKKNMQNFDEAFDWLLLILCAIKNDKIGWWNSIAIFSVIFAISFIFADALWRCWNQHLHYRFWLTISKSFCVNQSEKLIDFRREGIQMFYFTDLVNFKRWKCELNIWFCWDDWKIIKAITRQLWDTRVFKFLEFSALLNFYSFFTS